MLFLMVIANGCMNRGEGIILSIIRVIIPELCWHYIKHNILGGLGIYTYIRILYIYIYTRILYAKQKQPGCKKVRGQSEATNISDQKL